MMTTTLQEQLTALLREAGPAHHKAFSHTSGEDPDWPLWYAGYLHERLTKLLEVGLTKSELTCLLIEADRRHKQEAPHADWASYYADLFLQQLRGGKQ
jgi:hypothetical protein